MTGAEFDRAWRDGRRDFSGASLELEPGYIEAWQTRMRQLMAESDALWQQLIDEPRKRGNWLKRGRIDDVHAEMRARFEIRNAIVGQAATLGLPITIQVMSEAAAT